MDDRIIKSRGRNHSVQLLDCLSSLFALELLHPGPELYLISPWLSNVALIPNYSNQFRAICQTRNKESLHLADILILLAERGTKIYIITRPGHAPTQEFLNAFANNKNIVRQFREREHEKGLITSSFYVHGSMNFTYSGVNINNESVELSFNSQKIFTALQEARLSWEEGLTNENY